MSDPVIIAIISAIAGALPTIATIVTALLQNRTSSRHNAKQSIFQMILEDKVAVLFNGVPSNYQNVLNEYDIYHKNGGNSYVTEKVEAYKRWNVECQAAHGDNTAYVC